MTDIVTADFSEYGYRELDIAAELLKQYCENTHLLEDEVSLMFNKNSGCVFLTDSNCNVAMLNGDKLERFYSCPNCGHEGFFEEFRKHEDENKLQCPKCEGENGEIYK